MEGGRKDIVQIMRDAQKEENMEGEYTVRGEMGQAHVVLSVAHKFLLYVINLSLAPHHQEKKVLTISFVQNY